MCTCTCTHFDVYGVVCMHTCNACITAVSQATASVELQVTGICNCGNMLH